MISHRIAFKALRGLRLALFDRLSQIPQGYLVENPIGRVRTLLVDRVSSLEDWIAHVMPEAPGRLSVPLVSLIALFVIDWRVGFAARAPVPLVIVGMGIMMAGYESRMYLWMGSKAALAARAAEYIQGIPVIKAFLQEDASFSRYAKSALLYQDTTMAWWKQSWLGSGVMNAAMNSPLLAVVPVAFVLYGAGELDIFRLALCLTLPIGILQHVFAIVHNFELFQMVVPIWDEITTLLRYPALDRPSATDRAELDPQQGVSFTDVHFSYTDGLEVLHGVNFTAEPGQVTALVGPSGSGKSTIARLIASFWDADQGSITLGGVDLRQIPLDQLMEEISYVSQDTYLFEGTIRDNIRLGRPDATDEEIEAASRAARCHDFIMKLPAGYEADAGEAGGALSGGERQRISIARALLKDAPIILLDEATSSVDPENEHEILRALDELTQGRTVISIAHRLSTVADADQILVIDDGRLVQTGTHDELAGTEGIYADFLAARRRAANWSMA
ncbi:ABC transporter ATP-binding protein/permease [Collinsella sp. AGMB00827]|uniref:ABC transporter ATP-binding protein/permease n=2 Tax=Collinsella ureilytica TaxID=2869515 RepID=A0ABS7MM93_9ACTN|nr:ABC transporter ATP-binding protein/permease [Collinsella urealyticum]